MGTKGLVVNMISPNNYSALLRLSTRTIGVKHL